MDVNFQKLVLAVKETVLRRGQYSIVIVPGTTENEVLRNQRKILNEFEDHSEVVARPETQDGRLVIIVEFP